MLIDKYLFFHLEVFIYVNTNPKYKFLKYILIKIYVIWISF